jgi:zinc and cadmium transporter
LAFYLGASRFPGSDHQFLGSALAFTAGTFLCIAASDLLPELQFHAHDRVKLSIALLAGIALAALLGQFERQGHQHEPQEPAHHQHE